MSKFRYRLLQFLSGRNGMDTLNRFLLGCAFALDMVSVFIRIPVLVILATAFLVWYLFRFLSKNLYARQKENEAFRNKTQTIRKAGKVFIYRFRDKEHRYFLCPKCHQMVRTPKNHGKIEVTCPSCGNSFSRHS